MRCPKCQYWFELGPFPERAAFAGPDECWFCWAENDDPDVNISPYRADCRICFSTIYATVHVWAVVGLGLISELRCHGCGDWHDVMCTGYSPGSEVEKIYYRELPE